MCVHLRLEEALSQHLEERSVGGESNIEHSLGAIEAKTATLAASKQNDSNFTLSDELVTERLVHLVID